MQQAHLGLGKKRPSRSPLLGTVGRCAATTRILVPVTQLGDVEAALGYARAFERRTEVHVALLRVTSPFVGGDSADPGAADAMLEQAEARCRADAVAHDSHIVTGELVFSILDTAEMLGCDAIVMPSQKRRAWHHFFPANTMRKLRQLCRDVPLVLIDAAGAVVRSQKA
jgi:nucleotide-binding universal stress UspA family protein